MPESFDLISEPWIPVVGLSEPRHFKVGLEQLLLECQTYRNIQGVTPLETVAIYRLVLALLHTIFDVTDDAWKAMWREGHFERSLIASYLIECQQQNRFDLFDPTHPFFQDVRLDSKPESISSLRGHLASGADSTLFSHNTEQPHLALAPDEAACALLSIQSFGLGGTKARASHSLMHRVRVVSCFCSKEIISLRH